MRVALGPHATRSAVLAVKAAAARSTAPLPPSKRPPRDPPSRSSPPKRPPRDPPPRSSPPNRPPRDPPPRSSPPERPPRDPPPRSSPPNRPPRDPPPRSSPPKRPPRDPPLRSSPPNGHRAIHRHAPRRRSGLHAHHRRAPRRRSGPRAIHRYAPHRRTAAARAAAALLAAKTGATRSGHVRRAAATRAARTIRRDRTGRSPRRGPAPRSAPNPARVPPPVCRQRGHHLRVRRGQDRAPRTRDPDGCAARERHPTRCRCADGAAGALVIPLVRAALGFGARGRLGGASRSTGRPRFSWPTRRFLGGSSPSKREPVPSFFPSARRPCRGASRRSSATSLAARPALADFAVVRGGRRAAASRGSRNAPDGRRRTWRRDPSCADFARGFSDSAS